MAGTPGPGLPAPLEVWLEPGYDGGRVGAWLPAVPGVFGSADTAAGAQTAILTATARAREWLEAHGDPALPAVLGRIQVVGERAALLLPDGFEVNPTFPADQVPLDDAAVAATTRRIGWLRDDLEALAARVERHEAAHGPLPADEGVGERTAAAVLRHVAGAAAWYVGRLGGPDREGREGSAGDAYAWALGRLEELAGTEGGREAADEHGETWTVAKMARRMTYHAFDHLWELERRLARADGTRERVEIRLDRRPGTDAMVRLLRSVGWDTRAADADALGRAIEGTPEFAAAWDGDRLVGTARSLTDGALYAHIATVVVHPRYQGLGVGDRMLHALMDGRDTVRFALSAAPGMDTWYAKLGFAPEPRAMVRHRLRP